MIIGKVSNLRKRGIDEMKLNELKDAIMKEDFYETNAILEKILENDNALAYVEPLINVIESNPEIDYGMPGPVIHFIENFPTEDYVEILLNSLKRKPTSHTLWMLNRIINDSPANKEEYIEVLYETSRRSDVEADIKETAKFFYEFQINS